MIDCHCHILPNIDDGSNSMEESIKMAKIAKDKGTKTIISTSHFYDTNMFVTGKKLEESLELFREKLEEHNIDLEILLGNEAYMSPELPKYIEERKVYTLNNSKYLLVELPLLEMPMYTFEVLYELKLMGIIPIMAHPERYTYVMDNPNLVYDFIDKGALIQLNGGSIRGRFGDETQRIANDLLNHNMVHIIGSDGHGYNSRRPVLDKSYSLVKEKLGKDYAEELFSINPKRVLENKNITIKDPIKIEEKTTFIKKISKLLKIG
ncbi:tyrosine-protein phosphatase [Anaeromicrobium sediminis]|uniref:protein-tyrosine-phosphatase n=1 Tax=Anaeromicrobium sediminis TaxID=1478221 RepID=A0A267MKF5_9FIRM|nr:CpsB/CapC family capsule biosynthesis tyrosine phosphatase [Anaeromicrobium sediminis]PAB59398.1 hypothetical protein CCE28_11115 [Anaeromicrobium sediminis]